MKLPFEFRLHENRSTYLRVEKRAGKTKVHLHRLFLDAPSPVIEALIQYVKRGTPSALKVIRQMANLYFSNVRLPPVPLLEKGAFYDLRPIYESLKAEYFTPDYEATIGWSKRAPRGKLRSITFGTFDRCTRQISIHRLLDRPSVPEYFLSFVVYHEMLHAVCPFMTDRRGRTIVHTPEFKRRERQFAHYAKARAWEKSFFRGSNGRA